MPLKGMDFSRSNQAFARFNQFLQYDLLDQQRTERDKDLMRIQDRLMRERQAEAGDIEKSVAEYKTALSEKEAYTKAIIDIDKMPRFSRLSALSHMSTNPNLPEEYHAEARKAVEEYASVVKTLSMAYFMASRGQGTAEAAFHAADGGGLDGLTDWMQENAASWRHAEGLKFDREKLTAEGEGSEKAGQDEVTKRYITMIEKSLSHLQGQGVQGTALAGDARIFMENKTLNPLSAENQELAYTGLLDLWQRVADQGAGALSDGNKAFIRRVWAAGEWGGRAAGVIGNEPAAAPAARGGRKPQVEGSQPLQPQVEEPHTPVPAGGGVDLETGATPTETAGVNEAARQTAIRYYAEFFIQKVRGGIRDEAAIREATMLATEFVDSKIYPRK